MIIANIINMQVIWYLCIITDHVNDEDKPWMFSNIPYKDSFNSFRYAIKIIISMGSEEQQCEAYDDLI